MDPSFPKLQKSIFLNPIPSIDVPICIPRQTIDRNPISNQHSKIIDMTYNIEKYKDKPSFWIKVSEKVHEFFDDEDFQEHNQDLQYPDDVDTWIDIQVTEHLGVMESRIEAYEHMGDQSRKCHLITAEGEIFAREKAILEVSREVLKDLISKL